jgi:hypothetical protein
VVAIAGGSYHALGLLGDGAPFIATPPLNQVVYSGCDAALSVRAGGNGLPLHYQWLKEGNAIPGATNASLLLSGLLPSQAGYYTVTVSNEYGSALSANALVTVVDSPPLLLVQPADQSVWRGTAVSFGVAATGSTPLSYQWSFNGMAISGATNALLILANAQPSQAGQYQVIVANGFGMVTGGPAVLMVWSQAPQLAAGLTGYSPGQFRFILGGESGCVLQIQTSTNLLDWVPLILATNLANPLTISDHPANFSRQFYRARQWP